MSYGKPKVGDKVWSVMVFPFSGDRWNKKEPEYQPVTKVGRKYFYTDDYFMTKVLIESWEEYTEYSGNGYFKFYPTKEMWEEEELKKQYISLLKGEFHIKNKNKFSLEQLQRISKICNVKITDEKEVTD